MTRLVLISDTHGMQDSMGNIPDGDILIHAGDLTRQGTFAELLTVSSFFTAQPHQYKVIIAGNHDFCFEEDKERARKLLPGTIYLQDKLVEILGLKIYGSPWQPRFGDFAFNLGRGKPLHEVWSKIPRNTDILVTHGPPYGMLDVTELEQRSVGCQDLLEAVKIIKPKLHVFGHIHCGYGTAEKDGTTFVNASTCNEAYKPVNAPVVIDI